MEEGGFFRVVSNSNFRWQDPFKESDFVLGRSKLLFYLGRNSGTVVCFSS